jgi:hypothetical protein
VSLRAWIWLAPIVFLLHDAEELATAASWLRAHASALPQVLQPHAATVTTSKLAVSVGVLLALFVVAAWDGARRARVGKRSLPFLLASGALAGNALTHLAQAAYFGGYTPGVVTALLVCLPYSGRLERALERAGLLSHRQAVLLLAIGVLIQAPIALAALAAGGNLAAAAP